MQRNATFIVRLIITLAGFMIGALLGIRNSHALRANKINPADWVYLDPVFMVLYGAIAAFVARELGRCLIRIWPHREHAPGLDRQIVEGPMRLVAAAIGLSLGYEAAYWTAAIWDHWFDTTQTVPQHDREQAHLWIGALFSWGGALIAIGYKTGRRFAPAAGFVGAYLALDAVRHVAPRINDLYWGAYTSSDHVFFVWWVSRLISISFLVPCFAAVAYWSARSLKLACTAAGFGAAGALGAWIGFKIQDLYYNDLEWRVLEEVLFFLLGGLGALAGRELGRWVAELRAGLRPLPSGRDWTKLLSGSLLRIALAAVGLWLGVEIGYWLALLWDEYASAAPFAYDEIALVWIASGCAIGGALAVLGYRHSSRPPVAAALLGALLAFAIAPDLAPMQDHLYWGPFPSSDVHAEMWRRSLIVTATLAAALSMLGYVSAGWRYRRGAGGPA
jgi:hypothetical protein